MSEIISVNIKLKCKVYEEIEYFPLTGTFNTEEKTSGFIYDRTYASSKDNIRTQITSTIGGFEYNLIEGTSKKHWDGGVVSGCNFEFLNKEKFKWTPRISEGQYTIYDKSKNFYTDAAICKSVESNTVSLPLNIMDNTIEISLYKRDNDYNNIPLYKWKYKEHNNIDDGNLYFDVSKNDTNTVVTLNKFLRKDLSFPLLERLELVNADNISNFLEEKGIGNNSQRIIYSNYFPILRGEIQLYSLIEDTIYEWDLIDNVSSIFNNDNERYFEVDYEKGIIRTSGLEINETINVIDFNKDSQSIYVDSLLDNWPSQGIVMINGSYYSYEGHEKYTLNQLKSLDNEEIILNKGDAIYFQKQGYSASENEKFYINYIAVPRIDFQIHEFYRLENKLNLKPLYMNKPNGILQISPQEKYVSRIELEVNKNEIFLGNDTANLKATCYNGNNKKIDDILITFNNLSTDIDLRFEGDSLSISEISNVFGFATTSLLAPYSSAEALSLSSNNVNGSELIFEQDALSKLSIRDITLFQILAYNGIEKINDVNEYLNLVTENYKPTLVERLVYRWNPNRKNPVNNNQGAYDIVKPIQTYSNGLKFDFDLPVCIDSNPDSLVYKYKIYFSRVCRLQATCIDPASGNLIKSNEILLRISLPLHMKGISTLGIPYGFGFKNNIGDQELKVLGTGLGGANFITINPNVENIFNMRVSE